MKKIHKPILLKKNNESKENFNKRYNGVFRKLQTPAAPHPGQALLGAAEFVRKQ